MPLQLTRRKALSVIGAGSAELAIGGVLIPAARADTDTFSHLPESLKRRQDSFGDVLGWSTMNHGFEPSYVTNTINPDEANSDVLAGYFKNLWTSMQADQLADETDRMMEHLPLPGYLGDGSKTSIITHQPDEDIDQYIAPRGITLVTEDVPLFTEEDGTLVKGVSAVTQSLSRVPNTSFFVLHTSYAAKASHGEAPDGRTIRYTDTSNPTLRISGAILINESNPSSIYDRNHAATLVTENVLNLHDRDLTSLMAQLNTFFPDEDRTPQMLLGSMGMGTYSNQDQIVTLAGEGRFLRTTIPGADMTETAAPVMNQLKACNYNNLLAQL